MKFRKDFQLEARVAGLYLGSNPDSLITTRYPEVQVAIEGFKGDRHSGVTKYSGGRETSLYSKGTPIRNNRQWSAISDYELELIAQGMDIPEVKAEWIGANILLEGIPNLTKLPPMTHLIVSPNSVESATLIVYEENLPCKAPGEVIAQQYDNPKLARLFPKASYGHRGLIGWIEKPGTIREGDIVKVLFPDYIPDKLLEPLK